MPDIRPLRPGDPERLGDYRLTGLLGEGGQGAVYLAEDEPGHRVAVKLLHARFSADPKARSRFAAEVAVAQRVSAFCTARILDSDVEGDRPYIVSEYIDGPSLSAALAEGGPQRDADLDRLAIGTMTALAAIHQAGKDAANPHVHLVVRDRDPETGKRVAMLSEKGACDRVRILWEEAANVALQEAAQHRPDRLVIAVKRGCVQASVWLDLRTVLAEFDDVFSHFCPSFRGFRPIQFGRIEIGKILAGICMFRPHRCQDGHQNRRHQTGGGDEGSRGRHDRFESRNHLADERRIGDCGAGCAGCRNARRTVTSANELVRQNQRNAGDDDHAETEKNARKSGLEDDVEVDARSKRKAEERNQRMNTAAEEFAQVRVEIAQREADQKRQHRTDEQPRLEHGDASGAENEHTDQRT